MNDLLDNIGPDQFALLAFVLAISFSEGLNSDEVNSLGNFFSTVGSAMQLIAAQQQLQEEQKSK